MCIRDSFELLGAENHVLILGELVALHRVVAGHDLAILGTDVLLLEPRAALLVQHVERDARLRFRRRKQADGNRNKTEGDGGCADRASGHTKTLSRGGGGRGQARRPKLSYTTSVYARWNLRTRVINGLSSTFVILSLIHI